MYSKAKLLPVYTGWLQGRSLRSLAKQVGIGHSTLHKHLRQTFGDKATNTDAMSLIRSLVEDYPNDSSLFDWVLSQVELGVTEVIQHRSKHSLNQLSRFETLREPTLMDTIAVADELTSESWDFLRLSYYILVVDSIAKVLDEHQKASTRAAEAA